MDEGHLLAAARYVSLNPVRARLVARAEDWPWSSVRAHITGKDDGLVAVRPLLDRVPDFAALIAVSELEEDRAAFDAIRSAEGTGRPLGGRAFIQDLERRLARPFALRKPGRAAKVLETDEPRAFQAELFSRDE
jgi:putative transposase